jgi:hypothetical protein
MKPAPITAESARPHAQGVPARVRSHVGRRSGFSPVSPALHLRQRAACRGFGRWRRYEDAPGRPDWPNRDPIGEKGGLDIYGFVANTPVSAWDRIGLVMATEDVWGWACRFWQYHWERRYYCLNPENTPDDQRRALEEQWNTYVNVLRPCNVRITCKTACKGKTAANAGRRGSRGCDITVFVGAFKEFFPYKDGLERGETLMLKTFVHELTHCAQICLHNLQPSRLTCRQCLCAALQANRRESPTVSDDDLADSAKDSCEKRCDKQRVDVQSEMEQLKSDATQFQKCKRLGR